MVTPDRLNEFIFDTGKLFGALQRPELKEWMLEQGMLITEIAAIEKSLDPLIKIFYKDR